jgi:hypothetical protein
VRRTGAAARASEKAGEIEVKMKDESDGSAKGGGKGKKKGKPATSNPESGEQRPLLGKGKA